MDAKRKLAASPSPKGRCFLKNLTQDTVWQVLTHKELAWLSARALCRSYQPGQTIFHEGDDCTGIHFVRQGLIGLRRADRNGDSVLMRLAAVGDPLSYRSLMVGECHHSTAEVLKPSHTCFLRAACMREIFQRNPALCMEFLRRASRDLGNAQERFYQMVTMNLRARLAHLLLLMKNRYGHVTENGNLLIELPISRRDMADMIGVRSESLSRTIHQMTNDGVLAFSGRRVWIEAADLLIGELRS